jgi:deoxyribonuclease V
MPAPANWPADVAQARAVQEELRHRVEAGDRLGPVRTVAGVDVSYPRGAARARAAVVVLALPGLQPVASAAARVPVAFPYISGYLSFREVPAALAALERLETRPDLVLCDGQGIAHPRRLGLASHLGVVTGLATIGVAKSRLVGEHDPPPDRRGAWSPLVHRGEVVGAVLRTRPGVKPVYVSPGHRVGLETAVRLTLACTTRYRLPETTRAAHRLAGAL